MEDSIESDFAWAKTQFVSLDEAEDLDEVQEVLEQEFLGAVNALQEDTDSSEEEAEEKFREAVRKLQTVAYFAGYAFGVRSTSTDGADSITAVINADDATEIIKSLVSRSEIPLTIRVIAD